MLLLRVAIILVIEILHFKLEDLRHKARQCVVHLKKRVKVARVTNVAETCRLILLSNALINTSDRLVTRVMCRLLVDALSYSSLEVCILCITRCEVGLAPIVLAPSIVLMLGLQASLNCRINVILRGSVGWRDAALTTTLHVLRVLHLWLGDLAAIEKEFKGHLLVPLGAL